MVGLQAKMDIRKNFQDTPRNHAMGQAAAHIGRPFSFVPIGPRVTSGVFFDHRVNLKKFLLTSLHTHKRTERRDRPSPLVSLK